MRRDDLQTNVPEFDSAVSSHLRRAALAELGRHGSNVDTMVTHFDFRGFALSEWPAAREVALQASQLLEDGPGFALMRFPSLLSVPDDVRDFLLVSLAACLGRPTPTDRAVGRIVWRVTPRPLVNGRTPTVTEHALEAHPHTDSSYRDEPERRMLLFAVRPAVDGGGRSSIVDSRRLIAELRRTREGRRAESLLRALPLPFRVPTSLSTCCDESAPEFVDMPLLSDEPRIRFRSDSIRDGLRLLPVEITSAVVSALSLLENALSITPSVKFQLRAGELLVLNNHRMLHGRTQFHDPNRLLLRVRMHHG